MRPPFPAVAVPGLGTAAAAGWLASTLAGAASGAVIGGGVGGILGALKDAGVADDDAHVYAEGVKRGNTLVSVRVEEADRARGVDPGRRRRGDRGDARDGLAGGRLERAV